MRKIILLLAFLVSVAFSPGCGLFKKTSRIKDKELVSTKSETKTSEDVSVIERDKTVTVETEKAKGTVKTPEEKVTTDTDATLKDLAAGLTTVDSSLVSVKITLDTLTNKIKTEVTVKPRVIPYDIDKTKTTYADKTTETQQSKETHNKDATEAKIVRTEVKKEPQGLGWWWMAVVVVVIAVFFLVKRYLPKFPENK